ncbi:MAG: TolC family protein [Treponema sp.]|jgi:outer membrane protein TolC|nr:TolC family protein [Treponema sp.]
MKAKRSRKRPSLFLSLFLALFPAPAGAPEEAAGPGGGKVLFRSAEEAADFAARNSRTWILRGEEVLQNMKAAKWDLREFLPSFSFSLNESDSTAVMAGDSRSKSIQASINQKIFDGGKNKLAYETSRLNSLYAYQEYQGELREFRSGIIAQYYSCLIQEETNRVREDLLNAAREELEIIRWETTLGLGLETDYLEYLASCITIEHERDQGLRDLKTQERRLKDSVGLDREAELEIREDIHDGFEYFYYEPHLDLLWRLARTASVELKKQSLAARSAQKQLAHSRRWYVPSVGVQGSVSFAGLSYPLTEPKYSLKLTFDFSNLNLMPLSLNPGYGFERDRLYQVSNGVSASIPPNPVYPVARKLEDLAVLRNRLNQGEAEKELEERLYNLVIAHDSSLRSADTARRMIDVQEKRIEFSRLLVEQGRKKRIDLLNELIELSQSKISLREQRIQAVALERSLEILADFPFGGLRYECLER